jgi:hypothetical protein
MVSGFNAILDISTLDPLRLICKKTPAMNSRKRGKSTISDCSRISSETGVLDHENSYSTLIEVGLMRTSKYVCVDSAVKVKTSPVSYPLTPRIKYL